MQELKNKDEKIVDELLQYMNEAKPEGEDWQEVSSEVFYSRLLCCLCTLNERFSNEIDNEVDFFQEGNGKEKVCPLQYGDFLMTKEVETGKIYVCLKEESVRQTFQK